VEGFVESLQSLGQIVAVCLFELELELVLSADFSVIQFFCLEGCCL